MDERHAQRAVPPAHPHIFYNTFTMPAAARAYYRVKPFQDGSDSLAANFIQTK
jgi:hypothetical protein